LPNSNSSDPRKSSVPVDQCGAALALDVLPDRWTWLILRELFYGITRFSDIQAEIGIPKSVLSGRLTKMVENELAQREPYRDGSARTRYAYVLTGKGRDLVPALLSLMQWGDKHLRDGKSALDVSDKRSGQAVKVALVTEGGLPLRRLKYTAVPDQDGH
jgi:DNA-binding HxlR family transcriptional regulator